MTARERIQVEEVNKKLDQFIAEFRSWKKDFVQPLINEKAERTVAEKQLKTWGKWASILLGVLVSITILLKNWGIIR